MVSPWYQINCVKHGIVGSNTDECDLCFPEETQERHYKTHQRASKSDGGPSDYYDLPSGLKTFNDLLEWLAVDRWGAYALHMKDLMKGGFRFGVKDGTSIEYDCYKIIYSGCRLLVMAKGKENVREYLQKLLNDPQFK